MGTARFLRPVDAPPAAAALAAAALIVAFVAASVDVSGRAPFTEMWCFENSSLGKTGGSLKPASYVVRLTLSEDMSHEQIVRDALAEVGGTRAPTFTGASLARHGHGDSA